jgi:hypothetical protein
MESLLAYCLTKAGNQSLSESKEAITAQGNAQKGRLSMWWFNPWRRSIRRKSLTMGALRLLNSISKHPLFRGKGMDV